MTYGVVLSGFNKKTFEVINGEIDQVLKTVLGPAINTLPTSVVGQLKFIFGEREAIMWDEMEAVYNSQFIDTATGVSLDEALVFVGMERKAATQSEVDLRILGDKNTLVPLGFRAGQPNSDVAQFATLADTTIGDGINATQSINFSAEPDFGVYSLSLGSDTTGQIPYNADAATLETALNNLTTVSDLVVTGNVLDGFLIEFAGGDGEKSQPILQVTINTLEVNNNAIAIDINEEQAGFLPFGDAPSRCLNFGEIPAVAGTLTEILTPAFGVTGVTNIEDATVGTERETDAELRLRRVDFIQKTGTATPDKIRAAVLTVDGVTKAFVIENVEDFVDVEGRPIKCFETYVVGGNDNAIAQMIWDTKPAGIEAYGNITESVSDIEGTPHDISFSRPTGKDVHLIIEIQKNGDTSIGPLYPQDGDTKVVEDVMAFAENYYEIGRDVINSLWFTPINQTPGIIGLTVKQAFAPNPTLSDNLPVLSFEVAEFDTSRITIVEV